MVTLLLVLLVLGAVAGSYIALRGSPTAQRKLRITIHPKERVVLVAEGTRKAKNCPACWSKLGDDEARARCEINSGHEIHEACRELVKGKCPVCNGKLI